MAVRVSNFWQFLDKLVDRLPGWPSERQVVMGLTFILGFKMLSMAVANGDLWNIELFKTLVTVVIVTGCVNMVLAFHFAANKSEEVKTENTGKAFEAITAAAKAGATVDTDPGVIREGDEIVVEKK